MEILSECFFHLIAEIYCTKDLGPIFELNFIVYKILNSHLAGTR